MWFIYWYNFPPLRTRRKPLKLQFNYWNLQSVFNNFNKLVIKFLIYMERCKTSWSIELVSLHKLIHIPAYFSAFFFGEWETKRHLNQKRKKMHRLCAHMIFIYTWMILTFLLTLTCNNSNKIVGNAPELK